MRADATGFAEVSTQVQHRQLRGTGAVDLPVELPIVVDLAKYRTARPAPVLILRERRVMCGSSNGVDFGCHA